jgi:hypothetical protein
MDADGRGWIGADKGRAVPGRELLGGCGRELCFELDDELAGLEL